MTAPQDGNAPPFGDAVFALLVAEIQAACDRLDARGEDGRAVMAARLARLSDPGFTLPEPAAPRPFEGEPRLVGGYRHGPSKATSGT